MRKSVWIESLPGGYSVRYWEGSHKRREWLSSYDLARKRKTEVQHRLLAKKQGIPDTYLKPSECFEMYLHSISNTHRSSTVQLKRYALAEFLKSLPALSFLTEHKIIGFQKEMVDKEYSITTVSIRLRELRAFCNWAKKNKYVQDTPFTNIHIPASKEKGRKLTIEELKLIWENSDAVFKPYLAFLIYTGARRSEILKTKWSDINLKEANWTIPVTNSKTKRARTIPLDKTIISILQSCKDHAEFVFPGWTTTTPRWYLKKACRRAKLGFLPTPHDFRHTFASHWKGRVHTLMDMLGWQSIAMVKRYTHLHVEDLREEATAKGIGAELGRFDVT